MGYRGKLTTNDSGIELPLVFVEKHKELYFIEKNKNGKYYLNISSKIETKNHYDIIEDLHAILKDNGYGVYAIILWEDGRIYRYNLVNLKQDSFEPSEDEY